MFFTSACNGTVFATDTTNKAEWTFLITPQEGKVIWNLEIFDKLGNYTNATTAVNYEKSVETTDPSEITDTTESSETGMNPVPFIFPIISITCLIISSYFLKRKYV